MRAKISSAIKMKIRVISFFLKKHKILGDLILFFFEFFYNIKKKLIQDNKNSKIWFKIQEILTEVLVGV